MTQPTPDPNTDAGAKAAEQATAYNNDIFAIKDLRLDDGTIIKVPPHPTLRLLDDDALFALDQLEFELESYDRHPDIYVPEQKGKDRNGDEITLPAEVKPGAVKIPYRKTDPETGKTKLLNPPYEVQIVAIAIGKSAYAKLRAGEINGRKGSAADVLRIWNARTTELEGRRESDSKSDGGADVLEDVATPDRVGPEPVPPPADS